MSLAKTPLLNEIFGEKVAVFFSERGVDFVLKEDQPRLTLPQKEYLSRQLDFPVNEIINIRQVHGEHVVCVTADDLKNQGTWCEADGVITNVPNVPIAIRTADCLPVFIFDPPKNAIGLVHSGWRGSEKQITLKAVKLMREEWGCAPENLQVAFGPSIRACCYEVGSEFKTYFPEEVLERNDKFFLDLVQVNRNQLLRYGVKQKNIFDSQNCTCCDTSCFSYRREGKAAGRHLSLMVLKSNTI